MALFFALSWSQGKQFGKEGGLQNIHYLGHPCPRDTVLLRYLRPEPLIKPLLPFHREIHRVGIRQLLFRPNTLIFNWRDDLKLGRKSKLVAEKVL